MATKRAKDLLHPYDNRFILSDWQLKESWSNLHVLNIQAGDSVMFLTAIARFTGCGLIFVI